jgi:signal transduction histidine kinase
LFARRVEQQRDLALRLVSEQDGERRRMAAELYDEKAQVLAGALMMLRATDSDGSTSSAEHAAS